MQERPVVLLAGDEVIRGREERQVLDLEVRLLARFSHRALFKRLAELQVPARQCPGVWAVRAQAPAHDEFVLVLSLLLLLLWRGVGRALSSAYWC